MYENSTILYVNNLVGDVKANPRDFYRYINSQKKRHPRYSTPEKEEWKGCCSVGPRKAEEFNAQFMDVFNKNEHMQFPFLDRSAPLMNNIVVSKDGVI